MGLKPRYTRTSPFEEDHSDAGRLARVTGERGRFRVIGRETNPKSGASWWVLYGPIGSGAAQYRHVRKVTLIRERKAA